jgi:hypothetical protein
MGFYSPVFVIKKKLTNKNRIIFNMKRFNQRYLGRPPRFKMVTIQKLMAQIHQHDWMISLDLQDAYLHVPVWAEHRHLLRFMFNGTHYQWRVIPFGLNIAPWLFTRICKPVSGFIHANGITFDAYIDDCLMSHKSQTQLKTDLSRAKNLLHRLGWIVNVEKSELTPTNASSL